MPNVITNKEKKQYQKELDELRAKLHYAQCFTPHKVQYYQYLVIEKLNNAPVGVR